MNFSVSFKNDAQEKIYYSRYRNNCFSGGFGNGKTYVFCQKAVTLLSTFSNYGYVIARHKYTNLKRTTMRTFFNVCPKEFIVSHDIQNGFTLFKNASFIHWMHLDTLNEEDLRGLEFNSCLISQAEEVEESTALLLRGRVGRWDGAKVPESLVNAALARGIAWKKDGRGNLIVPNYFDIECNPPEDAGEFHWIYKGYHPDSDQRNPKNFYVERATDENLNDADTIEDVKTRSQEWLDTYFTGKWSKSQAALHAILPESILDSKYSREELQNLYERILFRGWLTRVLDHADSGITCCTWWAALEGVHIGWQEYYVQGHFISDHRRVIHEFSTFKDLKHELRFANYADPSIFKKGAQSAGQLINPAFEYADTSSSIYSEIPPIYWSRADNNEFGTRNRIDENLRLSQHAKHPITGISPAPTVYFLKQSEQFPRGLSQTISQTRQVRKTLLGSDNGKNIYSLERDDKIVDHAYDTFRYYIATLSRDSKSPEPEPRRNTLNYYKKLRKKEAVIRGSLL